MCSISFMKVTLYSTYFSLGFAHIHTHTHTHVRVRKLIGYKSEIGCFCIIFHIVGFSDELRAWMRANVSVCCALRLKASWKWQSGIVLSRNCRNVYIMYLNQSVCMCVRVRVCVCVWCIFIEMTVTYGFGCLTWNQWLNNSYTHQHFMNAMNFTNIKRNHEWMCVRVCEMRECVRAIRSKHSVKEENDFYSCWFLSRKTYK